MKASTNSIFLQNVRALKGVIEKHKTNPSVVVGTIVSAWCADSYPQLTQSSLPIRKRLLIDLRVKEFLLMLKEQPFLEGAYRLSSAYALLCEGAYRKSNAMYFTPPSLTERLLCDLEAQNVRFDKGSFLDPACGGAAFLAPIALRMKKRLKERGASPKKIITHVEKNLFGMEIDSALCALSHQFLKMALYEEISVASREPVFRIVLGNSLCDLESFCNSIDVLVCNPPYRKLNRGETEKYQQYFGEVIEGQPNMYGLFVALSIKLLQQGGICALVTPTSFLSGRYFSKLRGYLMKEARVISIGMVSERAGVFIDVLQETALTMLRRTNINHTSQKTTSVSVVSRDGSYLNVGPCVLPNSGSSWPIPRAEDDVLLIKKAAASKYRIKDYGYTVRIGIFVWNRDMRQSYMSAADVKQRKVKTAVPLLWSSDIKSDGKLFFDGKKKDNGEPCFVDFGDKAHCSVIRRTSVILQRVTSNEQPLRLVATVVPKSFIKKYGGFVGENHTVILEQVVSNPVLTANQMAALLGTYVVDRYFRSISGATNVSAFELSQLSLPNPVELKKHLSSKNSIEVASRMTVFGENSISVNTQNELHK